MNKKCSHCKKLLPETAFNWKFKNIKRSVQCRDCSKAYVKNHYNQNKKYYLEKAKKRNEIEKERCIQYIGSYLLAHPCIDCGESDILVLEFDHKERETKIDNVSIILKRKLAFKTLVAEIKKCDVRCANCHRKKTAVESNNWKLQFAPVA